MVKTEFVGIKAGETPEPVVVVKHLLSSHQLACCPDCGADVYRAQGCLSCINPACGFSLC